MMKKRENATIAFIAGFLPYIIIAMGDSQSLFQQTRDIVASRSLLTPATLSVGLIYCLVSLRFFLKERNNARPTEQGRGLEVISTDLYFTRFATISLASLVYTFAQAIYWGLGLASLHLAIPYYIYTSKLASVYDSISALPDGLAYIGLFLGALAGLVITRLIFENYILLFRAAQGIINISEKRNPQS
jgi:hypothetical protein